MRKKPWIALGGLVAVAVAAVVVLLVSGDARSALGVAKKIVDVPPGSERDDGPLATPALETPQELKAPAGPEPEASEAEAATPGGNARRKLPPGDVLLYEHPTHHEEFPGRRWRLGLGLTEAGTAFDNDVASAVEVPAGLLVTLYEHEGGQGHRVLLGAGLHNLAPYGFGDMTSSVRVTRAGERTGDVGPADAAELYEHRASTGSGPGESWRLALPAARDEKLFSARARDFANDTVSAAWVPDGHELVLFDEPDGRGLAVVLGPGFHELDFVGFNDRTSAARLRRLR